MAGEEAFIAEEAFLHPLGIIEPVNPYDELPAVGARHHAFPRGPCDIAFDRFGEIFSVDPDRTRDRANASIANGDQTIVADHRTHFMGDITVKGIEPFFGLKPDDIIVEQRINQLAMAWKR